MLKKNGSQGNTKRPLSPEDQAVLAYLNGQCVETSDIGGKVHKSPTPLQLDIMHSKLDQVQPTGEIPLTIDLD